MAVELKVETRRGGFVEGPRGYLSLPDDAVENPAGSGLYDVMPYLVPDSLVEGLYEVPQIEIRDYFAGNRSNIKGYSVQEDAAPVDPANLEMGVGQITVTFEEAVDTLYLSKELVTLLDSDFGRGQTQGIVRNLQMDNGNVTLTLDSILAVFNSDHVVPPKHGTFQSVFLDYCNLVGLAVTVDVHPDVADREVVYPGWVGNVWEHLKQIMSREQIEVGLVYDTLVVRPVRQVEARIDLDIAQSMSLNDQNTAKAVEIAYFNNQWGEREEVYPLADEDPAIYTVDAGEEVVVQLNLDASLEHVNQPVCVEFVEDRPYPGTNGVYSVAGNDGLPIQPDQWAAQGGFVRVELTDDPSIIEVTIRGASMTEYAPYRIAMTSGGSNFYNSLHITGRGVIRQRETIKIRTGATSAVTGEEIGAVVENPFISSMSEAYDLGLLTVRSWAGTQNVTATSTSVQPVNEDLQAFGNLAGARVRRGNAVYRISTLSTKEDTVEYTAQQDTLVSDFNEVWTGTTVAQFNAQWADTLVKDFNTESLRRN